MKVSFDIDNLLEEISYEGVPTIIALIGDSDALEYIVNKYVVQFRKDNVYVNMLVRCVLKNHNTKDTTLEMIAKCIKDHEVSSLHLYNLINHPNSTEKVKTIMEEFI